MAFPNNCNPRIVQVDESCGCTLTRASIRAMTPQDFEDQGFKEVGMDRIIGQTAEARMTGVPESSLMDLLLSRFAPIKKTNLGQPGQRSIIAPFILIPQTHNINANYFEVTAGVVHPGAGVGSVPASAWNITVRNHQGRYSTNLGSLQNYFLPGTYIAVIYKDSVTGVGRTLQFKVLSAVNADGGGVNKATISLEPNYSSAGWSGLTSDEKAVYQPTHGLVIPMANSVSNYESWCHNDPTNNTTKLLAFWLQTIRETHCYNDEYLKALNAPLTSDYFKKFRQLPLAKQRKQQSMAAERRFYQTIFHGQRIDDNQEVETYQDLPEVTDPLDADCTLEYKANTLGIRTQLADCGKVVDLEGAALDFDVIKGILNDLKRQREVDSGTVTRIDVMTDRYTKARILSTMISYYKQKYDMDTTRYYTPNQKLMFQNIALFEYDVYEFPDEAVELAVITHTYFDDYLSAMPSASKSLGRVLWFIDWSDITIGLAGSASVTRQTNVADDLYNCVITPNVKHYQLTSKTIAVQVPRPNRHAIYENFSDACPTITAGVCEADAS